MKISTLIKRLNALKKEHGDIQVSIDLEPYDAYADYRYESLERFEVVTLGGIFDVHTEEFKPRNIKTVALLPGWE